MEPMPLKRLSIGASMPSEPMPYAETRLKRLSIGASMPSERGMPYAQIGRPCAMWRVGADALCRLNAADDAETRHVGCPDGIGHRRAMWASVQTA